MGRIVLQDLASVLVERKKLGKKAASRFVYEMFDLIQTTLNQEKLVKVKGLGTFKIIDVEDRESVNINTGGRVLIESHSKITFTPDSLMKELVNKPFSQFETVVLKDGVDFDEDLPDVATMLNDGQKREVEVLPAADDDEPSNAPLVDFESGDQFQEDELQAAPSEEEQPEAEAPAEDPVVVLAEAPAETPAEDSVEKPVDETAEVAGETLNEEQDDALSDKPQGTEDEQPGDDNEGEEMSPYKKYKKWILPAVFCCLGLIVGYLIGQIGSGADREVAQVEKPAPKAEKTAAKTTKTVIAPKVQTPSEPKKEQQSTQHQASQSDVKQKATSTIAQKPVAAPAPVSAPVTAPQAAQEAVNTDKYSQMDARVRTGAYNIVGTDYVEKIRKGDNIQKICRRTLGPDMECYIEVYNGLKRGAELTPGQEIKIPKLELKKKKAKKAN